MLQTFNTRSECELIKENQRIFNRLLVLIDMVIIFFSMPFAYIVKFKILAPGEVGRLPIQSYLRLMVMVTPVYLLIYFLNSVYDPKRTSRIKYECFALLKANIFGIGALSVGIYVIIKDIDYARSVVGLFFFVNTQKIFAFCAQKRIQSEAYSSGGLFGSRRSFHRQNRGEPSVGIFGVRPS